MLLSGGQQGWKRWRNDSTLGKHFRLGARGVAQCGMEGALGTEELVLSGGRLPKGLIADFRGRRDGPGGTGACGQDEPELDPRTHGRQAGGGREPAPESRPPSSSGAAAGGRLPVPA